MPLARRQAQPLAHILRKLILVRDHTNGMDRNWAALPLVLGGGNEALVIGIVWKNPLARVTIYAILPRGYHRSPAIRFHREVPSRMRCTSIFRAWLMTSLALAALVSALAVNVTSARAATSVLPAADTPIPSGLDYSNLCPGDTSSLISGALPNNVNPNSNAFVTSSNGHCVKLGTPTGTPQIFAEVHSGDPFTIFGLGGWKASSPVQIWLSDAFPSYDTRHKWPLTNAVIGPDTDIHRECRISIKGNQANPLQTYSSPVTDPKTNLQLAFPEVPFVAPNVTTQTFYNIRVSIPNPTCTALPGATTETQATDALLIVDPAVATCVDKPNAEPCFTVSPQVNYPGQPFTVTGHNLHNVNYNVLISDSQGNNCTSLGTVTGNNVPVSFTSPPFNNLPLTNQQSGIYAFKLYLSTSQTGCNSNQVQSQNLFVSPPNYTIPTQVTSGDTVTITGESWQGGSVGSSTAQALQIVAFVGPQNGFDCAKATKYTLQNPSNDGSFTFSFKAPDVSSKTTDLVRVAAYPQGADIASACQSFDDTSCQTASPASTCPLIAVAGPVTVVPAAGPQIPWQYILLSLLLFLPLLPLFFFLGRRQEDEIIEIDEDITVEREVLDASNSARLAGASYARTIRVTKERVRIRDGKVLDKEVHEYDVYRNANGTEQRRLRPPVAPSTTSGSGQPATA